MAVPVTGHVQRVSGAAPFPFSLLPAIVLVAVFGLLGAAVDVVLGQEVRLYFGIGFGIGCGLAALLVRREDILRTIIWIPLVYFALLLIGTATSGHSHPGSWLVLAVVFKAPVVMIGWGTAVVIGIARKIATRRA